MGWKRSSCAVLVAAAALAVHAADSRLAKIASVQNAVESRRAGGASWSAAKVDEPLAAGDRVRTGPASRAAILYADDTLHRLAEKSEVEIVAPEGEGTGILKVLSGRHYFASRRPKDFGRVETATVTAAIKGTEFAVDVAEDGTTTVTMIEGVVLASNEHGSVEVSAGEKAVAEPGKAPVRAVVVRPRDAVAWTLYYPQVAVGGDADLARASSLLSAGQVEEASGAIDAALSRNPADPVALSLASVKALVQDRREEAKSLADRAVKAGPDSAAAALAASYVAQASFDVPLAAALAERAAALAPDDPTALVRVAELRFGQGDVRSARKAADEALRRAPDDARALSVLGFLDLADRKTGEARARFERAIASDSGLPEAHLGLGIAKMREGDVGGGLERLQAAVALDPGSALLRSYLGKAYYEERRPKESGKELAAAKDLDPNDPTPWLYSAVLLQNENRPVEALDDLVKSIALNDGRAVYRSRLLLDEDRAVRGVDLARIFNDLGFEQAGLVTARRSADADQANHSSHLFLAGNYRNVPRYAPAFLSEVLQARIYQPISSNAARPDLVAATASFNEYTELFDRPRVRAVGSGAWGTTDTDLSAFDDGSDCGGVPCYTLSENSSSHLSLARGIVSGSGDRFAAALSVSRSDDDGFRLNADEKNTIYRGFVQVAAGARDTLQLNVIHGTRKTGDLPLRQILPAITPERFDTTETNVGLGWHRTLDASSDLAVSAIWNRTEQDVLDFGGTVVGTAKLDGPQLEGQWVRRGGRTTWIAGAGGFDGTVELSSFGSPGIEGDDKFFNGYGYAKLRGLGPVELTAGLAVENADVPVALIPPRDSFIFPADLSYSDTTVSPKVGATATLPSGTTLRAGVYRRLAPFLGRLQTLEPTQVAGFNQFFEDPGGTRSWNYGAGVDQALGGRYYLGASYLARRLDVPQAYCDAPDPFSGCGFQQATLVAQRKNREDYLDVYVSGAFTRWMAATIAYDDEDRKFETTVVTPTGIFEDRQRTKRVTPEVRFFCPAGVFVRVAGTRYDQKVDQFDDLSSSARTTVSSKFWVVDASAGYRFPKRWGSVVVDATNLLNKKFVFYERSIQERVVPARSVVARLEITY